MMFETTANYKRFSNVGTACSEGEVVRSLEPFITTFRKHGRFIKQKMLAQEKIHVVMIFFVVNMHSHTFPASVKTSPKTQRRKARHTAPETHSNLLG